MTFPGAENLPLSARLPSAPLSCQPWAPRCGTPLPFTKAPYAGLPLLPRPCWGLPFSLASLHPAQPGNQPSSLLELRVKNKSRGPEGLGPPVCSGPLFPRPPVPAGPEPVLAGGAQAPGTQHSRPRGERGCPHRLLPLPWPELPHCPAVGKSESVAIFSQLSGPYLAAVCCPEARVSPWQRHAPSRPPLTRASGTGGWAFHRPRGRSFSSTHTALPRPQPLIPLPPAVPLGPHAPSMPRPPSHPQRGRCGTSLES